MLKIKTIVIIKYLYTVFSKNLDMAAFCGNKEIEKISNPNGKISGLDEERLLIFLNIIIEMRIQMLK